MIASNDYYLNYYPNRNQIVISLPQTSQTLMDTISPVIDRRTDVKESDLMCLLQVAQVIFCDEPIMPEDADFPEFCGNCGAKQEELENNITLLSLIRSGYNIFDDEEQPYYHALSAAISELNKKMGE